MNVSVKKIEKIGFRTCKKVGFPQFNIFSSLLINIYLNEFDQFMIVLKKKMNKKQFLYKNIKEWWNIAEVRVCELSKVKNKSKRESFWSKIKLAKKVKVATEQKF